MSDQEPINPGKLEKDETESQQKSQINGIGKEPESEFDVVSGPIPVSNNQQNGEDPYP